MEEVQHVDEIEAILELLRSEPENVALSLLFSQKDDCRQADSLRKQLRTVCVTLFKRVERLNRMLRKVSGRKEQSALSGLFELYTGESDGSPVDAETIFGQIELQNKALHLAVKKKLKKLTKSMENGGIVRLLDDQNVSDDDGQESDHQKEEDSSVEENEGNGHSDEEGDDGDKERKRIEARMQRALEDMDEEDDDEEQRAASKRNTEEGDSDDDKEESLVDPAAEELNDGFFDINEMEEFADEEEEYLPDEAFGEEKPDDEENEDKRSFHQKLRDGDLDDDQMEESDDEDNALLFKKESSIRRKRYRADDEIDALYRLYQNVGNEDDEDSSTDAVNMTAADLFGKPKKKYYDKWYSGKNKKKSEKSEEDSWDEYDFEKGEEKKAGWNDQESDAEDSSEDEKEATQSDDDEEDDRDESMPMKGAPQKGKKNQGSKKQDKLARQTEELEQELIAEKPWQMRGETAGTARPVDSLLDSTPEFELATKQAPIITVEKTMDLEEVIKKRILDEDWDDVVPRELPHVAWNKKRGELPEVSQEKSKLGLGELYEREYMKKALGYDAEAVEKETEEEKAKNEIRALFAGLCSKLDALSNYHFAPRPIADEAEVRTVTKPAIAMEEVLPLHVSEARGVAPEEVYGSKRGRDAVLRGESEVEQQDRKRMRSAKKAARRKARKEKAADEKLISKLQPGLGLNNPYEKRKMREELASARAHGKITTGEADTQSYGRSGTFFKRMQAEAQQSIRGASSNKEGTEADSKRKSKSSSVKL